MSKEELHAAKKILDNLMDNSHYQNQVDALRDMGWTVSAENLKKHLAKQGVIVK